ncbi:hypothetical protein [Alteromonas sp. V450]|nr:hypothetical protein [Alteromonas sp. V450]
MSFLIIVLTLFVCIVGYVFKQEIHKVEALQNARLKNSESAHSD